MDLHTSPSRDAAPRSNTESNNEHTAETNQPTSHSPEGIPHKSQSSSSTGVDREIDKEAASPLESSSSSQNAEKDIEKEAGDPIRKIDTRRTAGGTKEEWPDNLVDFEGPDDPGNPHNWSKKRRWMITVSMAWMTFVVTFASSIFSVAIEATAEEFHVGTVVSTLGVSLFLLGFVFGPVFFGPASEAFGRKVPLFVGYALFAIFQIPVAVAQNLETIMLGRFLSGFCASAPLAVVGGALADIWGPIERAYAICFFAFGAFCGPVAGPIMGGFITQSYLGWRWTAWITLILAALFGIIGLFCIPETSAARILQHRAKELRYKTKNWALHAKADENRIDADTIIHVYLMRPWVMIVQEPILFLITAYMSFLYGILYLLFEAYPIAFHEDRGWNLGVASLPFASFIVGCLMGCSVIAYSTATNFKKAFIKHGKTMPEERLPPMIVGAVVLPIGLFWFAWTSDPKISWVPQVSATQPESDSVPLLTPQVLSSALIGMGCIVTFWQGVNYVRSTSPHSETSMSLTCYLDHRLLRLLLQQRDRGQHLRPLHRGCRLPLVCSGHVPQARRRVGDVAAGLPVCGVRARAGIVLYLRRKD